MRPETEPWWKQAEADLKTAESVLQAGQFYAVSWFAQQAAEKALKALYVERRSGQLPPRTHDLRFLGAQVGVPRSLETDLDLLVLAFDLSRYPDDAGVPPVDAVGVSDATTHRDAARRTLTWVASQL